MKSSLIDLKQTLIKVWGNGRIKENEVLARHCNWRVGGPADLFFIARNVEELQEAVLGAQRFNQPFTILGFGANVLVSDRGIRGLVVLNRAQKISFLADSVIEADSGTSLAVLAKQAGKNSIGNLEFLIGIPGTVGAAVAVNAGTRTQWISTIVKKTLVLSSNGKTEWLPPENLDFSYRDSILKQTGEVVLTVQLQGTFCPATEVEKNMANELRVRKTQPTGPSAGSVFTNPEGDYAGRLIEAAGLKGFQVGGAEVSKMHANFILNTGSAKAQDIKTIIDSVKSKVQSKIGVVLHEEIRYLGDWSTIIGKG